MKRSLAALFTTLALAFGASALAWGGHYGHGGHGGGWHGGWIGYHHGGHHGWSSHFGLSIGVPLVWPGVGYYYVDRYPVTQVVVEREPQVYVQRETAPSGPAASGFWYYCPDSRTYYPYAQSCPSPWLQVVPQTSPQGPQ
ncbi:MAG: hypothetical protein HYR49_02225 [Gammaproteobacteria bacterium]|nr:hypothetical protein [Gammaproteobacteria bacterium]